MDGSDRKQIVAHRRRASQPSEIARGNTVSEGAKPLSGANMQRSNTVASMREGLTQNRVRQAVAALDRESQKAPGVYSHERKERKVPALNISRTGNPMGDFTVEKKVSEARNSRGNHEPPPGERSEKPTSNRIDGRPSEGMLVSTPRYLPELLDSGRAEEIGSGGQENARRAARLAGKSLAVVPMNTKARTLAEEWILAERSSIKVMVSADGKSRKLFRDDQKIQVSDQADEEPVYIYKDRIKPFVLECLKGSEIDTIVLKVLERLVKYCKEGGLGEPERTDIINYKRAPKSKVFDPYASAIIRAVVGSEENLNTSMLPEGFKAFLIGMDQGLIKWSRDEQLKPMGVEAKIKLSAQHKSIRRTILSNLVCLRGINNLFPMDSSKSPASASENPRYSEVEIAKELMTYQGSVFAEKAENFLNRLMRVSERDFDEKFTESRIQKLRKSMPKVRSAQNKGTEKYLHTRDRTQRRDELTQRRTQLRKKVDSMVLEFEQALNCGIIPHEFNRALVNTLKDEEQDKNDSLGVPETAQYFLDFLRSALSDQLEKNEDFDAFVIQQRKAVFTLLKDDMARRGVKSMGTSVFGSDREYRLSTSIKSAATSGTRTSTRMTTAQPTTPLTFSTTSSTSTVSTSPTSITSTNPIISPRLSNPRRKMSWSATPSDWTSTERALSSGTSPVRTNATTTTTTTGASGTGRKLRRSYQED